MAARGVEIMNDKPIRVRIKSDSSHISGYRVEDAETGRRIDGVLALEVRVPGTGNIATCELTLASFTIDAVAEVSEITKGST
jgi:hypothetical protein